MIEDKFQRKQIKRAKSQMQESIYAHLAALVEDEGIEEVFEILHSVASDSGSRKAMEKMYKKSKKWIWK